MSSSPLLPLVGLYLDSAVATVVARQDLIVVAKVNWIYCD